MTFSKLPPPISPVIASGVRIKTPEALKPAKWSLWSYKPYWELWDACCLTFDFEPDHGGLNRNVLHDWLARKRLPNNFPADFADRLDILDSNFNSRVKAQDLAEFALRCGWSIPDDMKALIKTPTPVTMVATPTPVEKAKESKEQREDRRLNACEAYGLVMPKKSEGRLPNGITKLAKLEGIERQPFSKDVKAAIERRNSLKREG